MTQSSSLEQLLVSDTKKEDPLFEYKESAFERLTKMKEPTPKTEAYRKVRLPSLLQNSYQKASLTEPSTKLIEEKTAPFKGKPYLVFYNGFFLPRFSNIEHLNSRIVVKPLSDAIYSYSVFFKNLFHKWIQEEKDFFALLAMALHQEGAFVYVPSDVVQKEPLNLIEIYEGKDHEIASPFVIASVGKKGQLNFSKTSFSKVSSKFLCSTLFLMNLEENASGSLEHSAEKKGPLQFEAVRVLQKQKSSFKLASTYINTTKHRLDCYVQLLGQDSQAEILTLSALKEKEEMHTYILVEHHEESCYSRQLVKNLYDDESRGSFEGKIYVHPKAQKTNAYQLNQNCLLSDQATIYSKPNLEIFADDVKASHGSTTGQIDQEHLFYLQSRGLPESEAKKLLLNSFCKEVVLEMKSQEIRDLTTKKLTEYFF